MMRAMIRYPKKSRTIMAGMAMGNSRRNQGLVFFISSREAYRCVVDAAFYLLSSKGDRYQVAGVRNEEREFPPFCHLSPVTCHLV
jgi:hypothetical protein